MTDICVGNVPSELLAKFDKWIKGKYANRSEAIRDLMRTVLEQRWALQPRGDE